jgi:Ca2+-binding EF-hand superfamily protein
MIQEVDTESGTIDFEEFVQMMQVKLQDLLVDFSLYTTYLYFQFL